MNKVLLVEDEPTNMRLFLEILNNQGFTVHTAINGIDAVRKAKNELYTLILMDIALPDMDGIEASRIIRSDPRYKYVPIIALTAYAMKGDRERILEAGLDDYIPKPISVPDFMKKMEKYGKWAESQEQFVRIQ